MLPSPRVFLHHPKPGLPPSSPTSDKHLKGEAAGKKKKEKNLIKKCRYPFSLPGACLTGLELRGADAGATEGLWNKQKKCGRPWSTEGPCICTRSGGTCTGPCKLQVQVPSSPGTVPYLDTPLMRLSQGVCKVRRPARFSQEGQTRYAAPECLPACAGEDDGSRVLR